MKPLSGDNYWNYFVKEGEASYCGWCQDKFGLRWQIVPENFDEVLKSKENWEVMMKQRKIILSEYKY